MNLTVPSLRENMALLDESIFYHTVHMLSAVANISKSYASLGINNHAGLELLPSRHLPEEDGKFTILSSCSFPSATVLTRITTT